MTKRYPDGGKFWKGKTPPSSSAPMKPTGAIRSTQAGMRTKPLALHGGGGGRHALVDDTSTQVKKRTNRYA